MLTTLLSSFLLLGSASLQDPCAASVDMLARGLAARSDADLTGATESLRAASDCHPDDRNIRLELAMTLAWQQQFDEALALYDLQAAEEPGDRATLLGRGRVRSWAGDLRGAQSDFEMLLGDGEDDVAALAGFAFVSRLQWRRDRARVAYLRILELEPGNGEATEGLRLLDKMKRTQADLRLGALMVTDGRRVVGNQASVSHRISARTRIVASASASSRIAQDSRVDKSGSLSVVRDLTDRSVLQTGYRVRLDPERPTHLVSTSLTHRLAGGWVVTGAVQSNALRPAEETLTRIDLLRPLGDKGYLLLQHYRMLSRLGGGTGAWVAGGRLSVLGVSISPSLTYTGGDERRTLDYAVGLSAPAGPARIGLQIGGSADNPRPRLGYVLTLR